MKGLIRICVLKILHYFKRALSLPPHIVLQKTYHKLKKEYVSRRKKYLDERFSTYSRNYPHVKLNKFVKNLDISLLPTEAISHLNKYFLNHEFDLLGSGWVRVFPGMTCKGIEGYCYPQSDKQSINEKNVSESDRIRSFIQRPYAPIDWHIDFKSGYRWREDTWSQNIQYGSDPGADIKVPWELSRMQHLTTLAWGFALEREAIYLREFQNQILDFIAANPPRYGVNWVCTMDVGIRISNWLIAYDLFIAYGALFDPEFEKIFIRSIHEHEHHILHHLEWDPYLRSNHYLANIAGLLFTSAYLPTSTAFDFSVRELVSEVFSQFNPDGSNFEASTSYHRLSTEMVVYATALGLEKQVKFPEGYLERIDRMGRFIRDITKPDGTIVQFGDNDSGRFIRMFPDSDMLDHRYLIPSTCNLSSLSALIAAQIDLLDSEKKGCIAYPDFGLYILNNDSCFLAIRCGAIGQKGNGGHAHNDQLSFELAVQGISMIIDPGTYLYTPIPHQRRRFRSTSMHNTLVIKNKEQNRDDGLFKMTDKAQAKLIRFQEGVFIGEQCGFGAVHRRTIKTERNSVEGIDEFNEGSKKIYFHLAPGWTGARKSKNVTEWVYGSHQVTISSDSGTLELAMSEISRAYGEKQASSLLILKSTSQRVVWKIKY